MDYAFTITAVGTGPNEEEAWEDAKQSLDEMISDDSYEVRQLGPPTKGNQMCNAQNQYILTTVLTERIGNKEAFTAYEISKEAQKRGADERHLHMRKYIHQCSALTDALEFGDYRRTLVTLANGPKAFLYHPDSYDPATYVSSVGGKALAQVIDPSMTDDGFYALDCRQRLMVPVVQLRKIGAGPGDRVTVVASPGYVMLTRLNAQPGLTDTVQQLTVERNGDLRLAFGILGIAGLLEPRFQIEDTVYQNEPAVLIYNVDQSGQRTSGSPAPNPPDPSVSASL